MQILPEASYLFGNEAEFGELANSLGWNAAGTALDIAVCISVTGNGRVGITMVK